MAPKKYTKAVAIAVSLSMIANFSPQVYASDSVAIPNNNRPPVLLANHSEIHSKNQFSVKSINKKLSSIIRLNFSLINITKLIRCSIDYLIILF